MRVLRVQMWHSLLIPIILSGPGYRLLFICRLKEISLKEIFRQIVKEVTKNKGLFLFRTLVKEREDENGNNINKMLD